MSETDKIFAGAIPALYDRYLRPMIFEPYAVDLAARFRDLDKGRLVETAAGTGAVTEALGRTISERVAITATDLNPPMLDYAATRSRSQRKIVWQQADASALPFKDGEFDALVCQFGVMFFPDKTAAFREAARVLKPGARFVFNVWDRIEHNEFAHVVAGAVAAAFPENPPMFLARTAHSYYDIAVIRDGLRSAGFTQIEIETVQRTSRAPSHRDPAIGFCQGSPLRNEIEARNASRLEEITEAVADAVRECFGEGPINGKIRAHVITAIR